MHRTCGNLYSYMDRLLQQCIEHVVNVYYSHSVKYGATYTDPLHGRHRFSIRPKQTRRKSLLLPGLYNLFSYSPTLSPLPRG